MDYLPGKQQELEKAIRPIQSGGLHQGKNLLARFFPNVMTNPKQFSRDAWDPNAEHWDARMGDQGNDFFKTPERPSLAA